MGEQRGTSAAPGDHVGSEQGPPYVELVRVIDRTIHVSPTDRTKEVDFTVLNPNDESFSFLFLLLRQFERNLEVHDEDGMRLNVYPNAVVDDLLGRVKRQNEAGFRRMQQQFTHADYRLFIQLPPERPLGPGELRTVQLTFEQSDPVEFHGIGDPLLVTGWIKHWMRKFFRIPSFLVDVERYQVHPHDVFIVVVGTPGYETTGITQRDGGEPAKEIYENGLEDDTRVLSVRLPPAENRRYTWDLQYDLVPNNRSLMKALVWYWVVAVFVGLFATLVPILDVAGGYAAHGKTLSGGFLTATIGLIFALDADWADRYKLLSLLPLLLHGMAWILWTLSRSPPP